jgi:hypothetical protein
MGKHSGNADSAEIATVKARLTKLQQDLSTAESDYNEVKNTHPALASHAQERVKFLKKDISEAIAELAKLLGTNRTFKLW